MDKDIAGVFALSGAAKEKFRVNANKLLNECFILHTVMEGYV